MYHVVTAEDTLDLNKTFGEELVTPNFRQMLQSESQN